MQRHVSIVKRLWRLRGGCRLALNLAGAILLAATPAAAEIYRYVDADGVIHYTDHIDKVPERYKDGVQEQKSLRSSNQPDTVIADERLDPTDPDSEKSADSESDQEGGMDGGDALSAENGEGGETDGAGIDKARSETPPGDDGERQPSPEGAGDSKRKLELERQALLEQKETLAKDKSYQKRKIKRRYMHRPQIKELMEEEDRIDKRLQEIEKELQ